MTCCTTAAPPDSTTLRTANGATSTLDLIVPDVHCAGCISRIEGAVQALDGVIAARLNLTTRRLNVQYVDQSTEGQIVGAVEGQGYECRRFDAVEAGATAEDREGRELLRALAIAGFAAANVMLLSVSVWSGAEGATRDLFHWISALIALPTIALAGQPFFRSAWRALRQLQLNMEVPISLAVILAGFLSVKATIEGGDEAFFDAAVMLLFFLLVGRYLDHRVRARARSAVSQLLTLWSAEATRVTAAGNECIPIEQIEAGDVISVAAGERIPVDGLVLQGEGSIDCSIVTGEADPVVVREDSAVRAGTLCLTHPLTIRATAVGPDTFLSQVVSLMEDAERSRGRHVRLADRAARIYAPAVHLAAALTFAGWMIAGSSWGEALWIAVSVLIITCPCALGLAVPAVQVVASGVLFRAGILLKDGSALERLAEIDCVALDKTGTITLGRPHIVNSDLSPDDFSMAASLARHSRHPLAKAVAGSGEGSNSLSAIEEHPGQGLSAICNGQAMRLGNRRFAGSGANNVSEGSEVWLTVADECRGRVTLQDRLRSDTRRTITYLRDQGLDPTLLSGDNNRSVEAAASAAGFEHWKAELMPADKVATLNAMKTQGRRPLMIGDGINDGPALAAAHVSIAPASASDVGRAAADLVFTGESLGAVVTARKVAVHARQLIMQNFGLALGYNIIAVPIAVLGGASPLVAAIAMSSSSIVVTLNALRLRWQSEQLRNGNVPHLQERPA
jgi:Cu2+-exporting ATPase